MILEDAAVALLTFTLCCGTFTFVSPIQKYVAATKAMMLKGVEDPILSLTRTTSSQLDITAQSGVIDIDGKAQENINITTDHGTITKEKQKNIDVNDAPEVYADTVPLQDHIKELIEDHPIRRDEQSSSAREHMDDLLQRIQDFKDKQENSGP